MPVSKKCEYCGKEFEAKRSTAKFCSGACKLKSSREKDLPTIEANEHHRTDLIIPSPELLPKKINGHWFGQAPHKPLWTTCEAEDCPHKDNKAPDWDVTCVEKCCV